jgi:hypothetical protein
MSLPTELVASEIFSLGKKSTSMLLSELTSIVAQTQEGLEILALSADATQWLKALTTVDALSMIQVLSHSLQAELIHEREPLHPATFAEFRADQGCEFCPCGDMDVYACSGECGETDI